MPSPTANASGRVDLGVTAELRHERTHTRSLGAARRGEVALRLPRDQLDEIAALELVEHLADLDAGETAAFPTGIGAEGADDVTVRGIDLDAVPALEERAQAFHDRGGVGCSQVDDPLTSVEDERAPVLRDTAGKGPRRATVAHVIDAAPGRDHDPVVVRRQGTQRGGTGRARRRRTDDLGLEHAVDVERAERPLSGDEVAEEDLRDVVLQRGGDATVEPERRRARIAAAAIGARGGTTASARARSVACSSLPTARANARSAAGR